MGPRETAERIIRETAGEMLGPEARVRLFGSRLDDAARGGDIDLQVEMPRPVDQPAVMAARFKARLLQRLGDQRIDVVFTDPLSLALPIHDVARRERVLL
jgi:predicted nucleotidyltransferase